MRIFHNSFEKLQIWSKYDKGKKTTYMKTDMCAFVISSLSLLTIRLLNINGTEYHDTHFVFRDTFILNLAIYETRWENVVEGQVMGDNTMQLLDAGYLWLQTHHTHTHHTPHTHTPHTPHTHTPHTTHTHTTHTHTHTNFVDIFYLFLL